MVFYKYPMMPLVASLPMQLPGLSCSDAVGGQSVGGRREARHLLTAGCLQAWPPIHIHIQDGAHPLRAYAAAL